MTDRTRTLVWIGAAILALLLLAAGLHDVVLQPGRPFQFDFSLPANRGVTGTPRPGSLPGWFPYAAALVLVVSVIAFIVSPRLRRDLLRNLPAILLYLFGAYLISQAFANPQPPVQPAAEAPPANVAQPGVEAPVTTPTPEFVSRPPDWLVNSLTIMICVAVAALLYLLIRRIRRRPDPLGRILDEARETLAALRAGADFHDTISRCYADMVRVFSDRRGMGRDLSLTPREFEQRLVVAGLADSHIRRLTRLFERVRYSPHPPTRADEREAEACLQAIIEAYGNRS